MRAVLEERGFPVDEIRYFASARSVGLTLPWKGKQIPVEDAAVAALAEGKPTILVLNKIDLISGDGGWGMGDGG